MRPDHFDHFDAVAVQPLSVVRHLALLYATQGPAYAGVTDEGIVICLAGFRLLRPRTAEGWAIMSTAMPAHWRWMHRTVAQMLPEHIRLLNLRRVEITVEATFLQGQRWAEALGFVNETPDGMAQFGPNGERHYLYARV